MAFPDFAGGSILNLMRSIGDACGAAPLPYAPLREPVLEGCEARSVVLLVIDGLGQAQLDRGAPGGALHRHLRARLTSVFPSTTASAVTTLLTGLAPNRHALTGWHIYFRELDAVTAILPLRPRAAEAFAEGAENLPARLFGYRPFADCLARPAAMISPQSIARSPFNRYHAGTAALHAYRDLDEMFARIAAVACASGGPAYVHAYYPRLDTLSHEHGAGADAVIEHLQAIDSAFGRFLERMAGSNAIILVTADHGFIDSPAPHRIELDDHPRLAAMLERPLCGEARVAYCYVRPEAASAFEDYAAAHLPQTVVRRSAELVAEGGFGPGAEDPRLLDRIGSHTLIMRDRWTIYDRLPNESPERPIGVHGGLSPEEMIVPLIVANP